VKFRFFADSSTGQVGAKLPIRLHSRLGETLALLTIEGENILSHEVLTLKPGYNPLDFTPGHEHYPNFRIAVAAIDDRTIRSAHKDLTVERELRVTVKPRNKVEAPGADGLVDLVVTDQNGKPVQAALSLALVNEALYSLYPEKVPPILDFFQSGARRNAEFRLGSTCGFAYTGRTRPVVKSITEEKERLARRQLEQQKLAELRLANRAAYGAFARDEIVAELAQQTGQPMPADAQPLSRGGASERPRADMPAPATVPAGEAAALNGGLLQQKEKNGKDAAAPAPPRKEVMNASRWIAPIVTDKAGKATVTIPLPDNTTEWRLTARGCTRETLVGQATSSLITRKDFFLELKTPVMAQEGDEMRFLAKLHNLTDFEGKVDVTLNVKGGGGFKDKVTADIKKHSVTECAFKSNAIPLAKSITLTARAKAGDTADTLVVKLPVRPWGMEYVSAEGGIASGNAHGVLELPGKREYTWQELEVTLSPSVRQALVDFALRAGRSSGQADDLLASVSALDYATSHDGRDEDIRVLRDRVQTLVASLTSTQQDDGRWQWRGASDLYLTCRSYWALALASKAGIPLQPDVLSKTEKNLTDSFSKLGTKDNDAKTIVLHALSVTGKADFAHLNRIYRERAGLSNNALARAAVAMINLDRPDFARDLVELLEKNVKLEGPEGRPKLAWWEGSGRTILQDRNETTAMALLALAGVKPDSPLAAQAANMLLRNQGCFHYRSPKAAGPAVAALAAYHGKAQDEKADFEVTVLVNNKQVATLKSSDVALRATVPVPAKLIKEGENIVRFEKKGPGTYHYAAVLTGFSPELKNPNSWAHHLTFTGGGYYHDNLTYRGVPLKSASSSPVTKVEMGQKIRATSTVQNYSNARQEYRVRREFLPAGMLLVEGSLKGDFQHHEIGDGVITMFYSPGKVGREHLLRTRRLRPGHLPHPAGHHPRPLQPRAGDHRQDPHDHRAAARRKERRPLPDEPSRALRTRQAQLRRRQPRDRPRAPAPPLQARAQALRARPRPHAPVDLHHGRVFQCRASRRNVRDPARAPPGPDHPLRQDPRRRQGLPRDRRTRARMARLPRHHRLELHQRRQPLRHPRGPGTVPRQPRLPRRHLARVPGHLRGRRGLLRDLPAALRKGSQRPRAQGRGGTPAPTARGASGR
jgi:hypothetical protein